MAGKALLQSPDEWNARNRILAANMEDLIALHVRPVTFRALDLGCQTGKLIDILAPRTGLQWHGIDPNIKDTTFTATGAEMRFGWGHEIPFPDGAFDCVLFANVYEHVEPAYRQRTLKEIRRVLAPSGILVGQLPNPYFPIESHSRLPFMGWLPVRAQKEYWRFSPVPWKHNFHVVTISDLIHRADRADLSSVVVRNFNYPLDAIPFRVRRVAKLLARPMQFAPWAWQFVFQRRTAT